VARWRILSATALALMALAGCGRDAARQPLRVAAAVSLTEALDRAVRAWEAASGDRVTANYAASNVLARQIEEGAPADLFISADVIQMERLVVRRLVLPETVVTLLSNQLVVVSPADRPLSGAAPGSLADPAVTRLALGDPDAVPAGHYARSWLTRIDVWPRVSAKVVPAASVRAAMAAVEAGNADAAVVYRTDARGRGRLRVEYVVPVSEGPSITYPAAVVAASRAPARARALLDWLRGEAAGRIFADAGFLLPADAPAP
jgi:molybdate transport system substrate-binding protein